MLDGRIMAGFECATHRKRCGARHDFIAATRHDRLALRDYALLRNIGVDQVREGLRWHLIEPHRGSWDWSTLERQRDASRTAGVSVMWDLLHYGWPDWLSPLNPEFVPAFARFAAAAAERLGPGGWYIPVNEISFLAWGGGRAAFLEPFRTDCADALKETYCRAAIAATRAVREVDPDATIGTSEPLIHVVEDPDEPNPETSAAGLIAAQHDAAMILLGRREPDWGGSEAPIDFVGLNYYPHNQFDTARRTLARDDARRRPLCEMLLEAQALYALPLALTETGAEDDDRAAWLADVCQAVRRANALGADTRALCLYPILNHLGWDDDRYCAHGLFCGLDEARPVHAPLAAQIAREQRDPLWLPAMERAHLPV